MKALIFQGIGNIDATEGMGHLINKLKSVRICRKVEIGETVKRGEEAGGENVDLNGVGIVTAKSCYFMLFNFVCL